MADNITIPAQGAGTVTPAVATDDIGGRHFQRVKVVLGADGVNDGDVAAANPMPVVGPLTDAELRALPVPVDGSAVTQPISAAALPLPAGAATEATLATLTTPTDTQPISAVALPLPAGAATEATLATLTTPADTQPVSAAAWPLPTGAATEATLQSLVAAIGADNITTLLRCLIQIVANPAYVDKSANQMRAQVTGTITTVTTVTTVTGLTNVDGYQGKLLPIGQNMAAWALTCRARIT